MSRSRSNVNDLSRFANEVDKWPPLDGELIYTAPQLYPSLRVNIQKGRSKSAGRSAIKSTKQTLAHTENVFVRGVGVSCIGVCVYPNPHSLINSQTVSYITDIDITFVDKSLQATTSFSHQEKKQFKNKQETMFFFRSSQRSIGSVSNIGPARPSFRLGARVRRPRRMHK